ncbi:MAG: hypothetical protein WDN46_23270 [Methylocella sp.]
MISSVDFIIKGFDSKIFSIPSPVESVKGGPLIGEQAYRLWAVAATVLLEVLARLKPFGGKLLDISGTVVVGLLEFVAAIIISGFLYSPDRSWPTGSKRSCAESMVNAVMKC